MAVQRLLEPVAAKLVDRIRAIGLVLLRHEKIKASATQFYAIWRVVELLAKPLSVLIFEILDVSLDYLGLGMVFQVVCDFIVLLRHLFYGLELLVHVSHV